MNLTQLTKDMPELIRVTKGADTEIRVLTADSRAKRPLKFFIYLLLSPL